MQKLDSDRVSNILVQVAKAPFPGLLVGVVKSEAIALPSEVALMHFPELGRVLAVGLMEPVRPLNTLRFSGLAAGRPNAPRFFYLPSEDRKYLYTYERDIPKDAKLADVNRFEHLYAVLQKSAVIPVESAYNCDESPTIETDFSKRVARLRETCSKL